MIPPLKMASDYGDYIKAVENIREQVTQLQQHHREQLPMWVVFGPGTSDQPGMYLARLWFTIPRNTMTSVLLRATNLAEIRDLLPNGLVKIPRSQGDDPNIIETWI
jgi:hypothetical protein